MENMKVGCCGFGMSQAKYFERFSVVEVQQTFYQPPTLATLLKWRAAAPEDFEFVLKAWQLITHTSRSPTYRRLKRVLTASESEQSGAFRNSNIVTEALDTTLACAQALQAKSIVFQCPASFTPTEEHMSNLRSFFTSFERPLGMRFYWEPRGEWKASTIKALCHELNLYHTVDPFISDSTTPQQLYFRLHGIGGWRYTYRDSELLEVYEKIKSPAGPFYVFFNNMTMTQDASRFQTLFANQTA